ncbi:hypothetical protein JCM10908_002576 [Rhodotorula pacifica]|uniref:uncharacterized protein n=1 Tax=Rhodotorula pacifica TaxID=1495444 RepID=UPI0031762ED8
MDAADSRNASPRVAGEQAVARTDHAVVEIGEVVSPAASDASRSSSRTTIELQTISPPAKPSRRPASFDAAAILEWRAQGIALPLSPSPETSPTLVASTYSPGGASTATFPRTTKEGLGKKQYTGLKPHRRSWSPPRPARPSLPQPVRVVASTLTALLLVCNPYTAPGRLDHSDRWPDATRWIPYDPSCAPPSFLATLRAGLKTKPSQYSEPAELELPLRSPSTKLDTALPLPWLVGKTVVLVGDHVERAHAKDFCRYTDGQYAVITADHALSPRPFVNGIDERWALTQGSLNETRPTICYNSCYDFVLVSIFHFGLGNRVEFEHESLFAEPHFYPPAALRDRLDSILLPILAKLGRTSPDLVEFASGFWDLRHFAAVDRHYGLPVERELSPERLEWYTDRLVQAFSDIGALFPKARLLWRPLFSLTFADWAAPVRSIALERLAARTVTALNVTDDAEAVKTNLLRAISGRPAGKERARGLFVKRRDTPAPEARSLPGFKADFLNRVHERIGDPGRLPTPSRNAQPVSLRGRLEIDPWPSIIRGREPLEANPGGYVWVDVFLYE